MFNITIRLSGRYAYHRSNNCLRNYYVKNQNSSGHCIILNKSSSNVSIFEDKRNFSSWPPKSYNDPTMSVAQPAATAHQSSTDTKQTHTNRLINEKSPYLLQHAHNPVDWYPWGDEAIEKARKENKAIFLSVGYSTCHWCHVMEKESFENAEVAQVMNQHFINIKVDREERPDIDKIYMQFVLMINNSGGWPMSVWLTPDLAPITAGTYFPPKDRWGMPGFVTVLNKVAEMWNTKRQELTASGLKVIDILEKTTTESSAYRGENHLLSVQDRFKEVVKIYKRNADTVWGGFGTQPKFPEVSKINLAFHAEIHERNCGMAELALHTLKNIANGGIHDHIFGGFCRYSVDRLWHIPHFEKMLYDQGQLLMAYTNAYKLTRNNFYLDVADKTFQYIQTDLRHPNGGYFSGEDADSYRKMGDKDKIEGAFYAWTYEEVRNIFEENSEQFHVDIDPFEIYAFYYGIEEAGNVQPSSDPHGHLTGQNIPRVRTTVRATAELFKVDADTLNSILSTGNQILHSERNKRPRPHLDTKILTAWNGLVLSGISRLACVKGAPKQPEYLKAAKELVQFIKTYSYDEEKKILIRSCYGENPASEVTSTLAQPVQGFLDDYAFFIKGLIDYYVATLDVSALRWAKELQDTQDRLFLDTENGGYFYSQAKSQHVVVRLKEDHDGAEPCGNSVAARNLLLLSAYFEDKSYKAKGLQIFEFFSSNTSFGYVLPEMFSSQLLYDESLAMMVVVGPNNEAAQSLFNVARDFYIPGLLLIHHDTDKPIEEMTRKSVAKFKMVRNEPTVYLCHNRVCQLPITSAEDFRKSLTEKYLPTTIDG